MLKKLEKIKSIFKNSPLAKIKVEFLGKTKFVFAKCEWFSLTGSIKDKVAYQIFYDAIKQNIVNQNTKIVEVTSGNMGISVCAIANILNLSTTIILPKNMSEERKKLLKLYGANIIEVPDFKSAFKLCSQFEQQGYFCPHQFENKSNFNAHYKITGKELAKKLKDYKCNNFVCGVGTSGSLSGCGSYLKEHLNLKVIAIQPKNSQILTNTPPFGKHKLQGLADEIVPKLYSFNLVDSVISITDEDAISMSQKLCNELSLGVGISSGANFLGAVLCEGNNVTLFADDNKKYLSTDLSIPITTNLTSQIKLLDIEFI